MRKILSVLCVCLFLTGCHSGGNALDRAISLRNRILQEKGCVFDAVVTADYGTKLYTFRMNCQLNADRSLYFTVIEPDMIAGIFGTISAGEGIIEFADTVLVFPMLSDGQITPVTAPWVVMNTLSSGYIQYCGDDGEGIRICINDSYLEDALNLDIWTDGADIPIRGEILWGGSRILTVDIRNFRFL